MPNLPSSLPISNLIARSGGSGLPPEELMKLRSLRSADAANAALIPGEAGAAAFKLHPFFSPEPQGFSLEGNVEPVRGRTFPDSFFASPEPAEQALPASRFGESLLRDQGAPAPARTADIGAALLGGPPSQAPTPSPSMPQDEHASRWSPGAADAPAPSSAASIGAALLGGAPASTAAPSPNAPAETYTPRKGLRFEETPAGQRYLELEKKLQKVPWIAPAQVKDRIQEEMQLTLRAAELQMSGAAAEGADAQRFANRLDAKTRSEREDSKLAARLAEDEAARKERLRALEAKNEAATRRLLQTDHALDIREKEAADRARDRAAINADRVQRTSILRQESDRKSRKDGAGERPAAPERGDSRRPVQYDSQPREGSRSTSDRGAAARPSPEGREATPRATEEPTREKPRKETLPTAVNPETGETLVWNGKSWAPVGR